MTNNDRIEDLLENNKRWSRRMIAEDPKFFSDRADEQQPKFLWIGCSDSRVLANTIIGLTAGEVFVHRNVANLVVRSDKNCAAVIAFAVEILKVRHIIVCGHYGCGGVLAALEEQKQGLLNDWLRPIREIAERHADELGAIRSKLKRADRLCELNIAEQVINVGTKPVVLDAWARGQDVSIHGWIYNMSNGLITDMDISVENIGSLRALRAAIAQNDERKPTLNASNKPNNVLK